MSESSSEEDVSESWSSREFVPNVKVDGLVMSPSCGGEVARFGK